MRIGFIGAGNMASALLGGILRGGMINPEDASISDKDSKKLKVWEEQGVGVTADNTRIEEESDVIFFAVKPNMIRDVLLQMKGYSSKIYVSIAAGVTLSFLEGILGKDKKIIRTMPNTPAMVGCGMTVIAPNEAVLPEEREKIIRLFEGVGSALIMPEKDLEIATALHGSSPAYAYIMVDAMADAGVRHGLSKENAIKLAAKALEGSAKMVLETGVHPEELKDQVCSPGGTTIAAVCELERTGFRTSLQAAIDACIKKNQEMRK